MTGGPFSPESKPRVDGRTASAILAVAAVSLFLRIWAVRGKFLWFDEFLTALLARNSWGRFFAALRAEAHPPLYFLMMKGWVSLFGDGRIAMKSLSIAAGAVALAALVEAVRRAFGSRGAVTAAILFSFATVQIDQSTDAKGYAVLTMFLCLLLWSLIRLAEESGQGKWLGLSLVFAAAAGSTHFYGAAAAGAIAFAAVLAMKGSGRRNSAIVLVSSAVVSCFWLPAALSLPRGASDYIRDIWAGVPKWAPILVSTRISLPGWRKPYPPMTGVILPDLSVRELFSALFLAGIVVAAMISSRRDQEPPVAARRFLFLAGGMLFGGFLLLETVLNFLDRPIGLPGRFEVVTELGLAILAAGAISRESRSRGLREFSLAAVCLWTAIPQWRPGPGPLPRRREEVIVGSLLRSAGEGRPIEIVTLGLARPPFDYYRNDDPRILLCSFPASQQDHIGWRVETISTEEGVALSVEAESLVRDLREKLERGVRVFVAARPDPRNEILLSRLRRECDLDPTPFAEWFFELRPSAEFLADRGPGRDSELCLKDVFQPFLRADFGRVDFRFGQAVDQGADHLGALDDGSARRADIGRKAIEVDNLPIQKHDGDFGPFFGVNRRPSGPMVGHLGGRAGQRGRFTHGNLLLRTLHPGSDYEGAG